MQFDLSDKTALVTGASAGIGTAIARSLAREGVRLAITARREAPLRDLAVELEAAGAPPVLVIPADIADRADCDRMAATARMELGRVDILVNCAGASRPTTLDGDDALWDEAHMLNFTAIRRLTHGLVPDMRTRRWGRIVNITGAVEQRQLNAAATAKAGLHVWAKGLACLVAKDGVTVNSIVPGRIWSEQIRERLHPDPVERQAFIDANIPIGRFGEPEELAVLATFLASPLASYITGTVIPVDGGMQRFPH
jgi:3-oxoacyl-[acyl-carrier protein] reductase